LGEGFFVCVFELFCAVREGKSEEKKEKGEEQEFWEKEKKRRREQESGKFVFFLKNKKNLDKYLVVLHVESQATHANKGNPRKKMRKKMRKIMRKMRLQNEKKKLETARKEEKKKKSSHEAPFEAKQLFSNQNPENEQSRQAQTPSPRTSAVSAEKNWDRNCRA